MHHLAKRFRLLVDIWNIQKRNLFTEPRQSNLERICLQDVVSGEKDNDCELRRALVPALQPPSDFRIEFCPLSIFRVIGCSEICHVSASKHPMPIFFERMDEAKYTKCWKMSLHLSSHTQNNLLYTHFGCRFQNCTEKIQTFTYKILVHARNHPMLTHGVLYERRLVVCGMSWWLRWWA